jgi:hypothetical protein
MPGDLCKHVSGLCVLVWLFTVVSSAEAQTVKMSTTVSETVVLSVAPSSIEGNDVRADVVSSGNTVRMTLSGNGAGFSAIRVPLLVRSNTSFKILGGFESTTAQLNQVSVINVRATGRLVSTEAVDNLEIPAEFDASNPFLVVSGPRVSLGGTLNSPDNALRLTLLVRIKSDSVRGWLAQLTFFND